jgi:hypothetical protein
MVRFFFGIAFFAVATSVFAGEKLNALVTAAQDFSVAIQEQLSAVQGNTSPAELVERTLSYAKAKTAYFNALRAEIPEMTDIATGRQPRPSDFGQIPGGVLGCRRKAGKGGGSRDADSITTVFG